MFRSLGFLLFVTLLVRTSWGQAIPMAEAEQLKTNWTLEKIENPPARTTKFVSSDKPLSIRLTRIDPTFLTQKFAARFELAIRNTDYAGLPRELYPVCFWPSSNLPRFFFYQGAGVPQHLDYTSSMNVIFERLVQQIPADKRPADEQLSFFLKTPLDEGYLRIASISDSFQRSQLKVDDIRTFTILAPTAELAQERAQTLLTLLDWGLSRPVQRAKWEYRASMIEEYPKSVARIEETKAEYAKLQQEYADFKEFTDDLRPGVKVQLAEAEADLADVTARVAECEKLLSDPTVDAAGLQQLRNLRLNLRVEIKGATARRDTLAKYMENITKANQLRGKIAAAIVERESAPKIPALDLRAAIGATRALDQLVIHVIDDSVQIQPVKWEPGTRE